MFSGQCFVHTADSTELTAHTAGITVVIFRKTVITDSFGCFRIKSTVKLCIPVKDTAGICFSAMDIGLTRNDRFRFMKIYSGKTLRDTLREDAGFWRAVESAATKLYNKELRRQGAK